MTGLADLIAALVPEDGHFDVDAPANWSQGRTLYGGITAALCFEAAKRVAGEAAAPLRSAQLAFIGPAGGRLRFTPRLLRQGRSVRLVPVDCESEAGIAARAIFAFGAARESRVAHDRLPAPAVPPPDDCPDFIKPDQPPRGFIANFELRIAAGANTYTPGAAPDLTIWVRHKDAAGVDPTTALLALADCLPPAAMVAFPERALISTMTWTVDFAAAPASGEDWHLLRSSSQQSGEGYSLQDMSLWDSSGALIAAGRQVIAIFV